MKARGYVIVSAARILMSFVLLVCLTQMQALAVSFSPSWQIELITFENLTSAQSFIDRLAQKGIRAEVVAVDTAGAVRFRTQSQLLPSFESAELYRRALQRNTNLYDNHILIRGPTGSIKQAWSIDLLRFVTQSKAAAFVDRLLHKGFDVTIVPLHVSGGVLYQTSAQSFSSFDQAFAYRERLKQRTNIADSHLQIVSPISQSPNDQINITPYQSKQTQPLVSAFTMRTGAQALDLRSQALPAVKSVQPDAADGLLPDWHVYGSNTLRSDVYKSKGDLAATPYRFSSTQSYDELNLNFNRQLSPFNRVSGQINGLAYNDSLYRSQFSGVVLERINLKQENGEFFIPYRAEIGDFFAYQSFRTIQRSLKGARVEFQPTLGGTEFRHSVELFSGTASVNWDDFQYKDDFSAGGSWLLQHPVAGTLVANLVFNNKQANGFAQPGLRQYVSSLAWEKRASMFGQKMTLEAEAGRFIGDHPVVLAAVSNLRRQGNGFFAQVSGTPDILPQLTYRFRGEAYDQNYRPNGASIQSDRRSEEGYLTWRTERGLAFTTRLQNFHTAWQTNNPSDTITYGGNISGVIPVFGGISGSIDAFGSNVEDRNLTVNTMAKVVNANLNKALGPNLSARAGFYYANNHDKNNPLGLNITRQYLIGADYRFQQGELRGTVSPGVTVRRIDQQGVRWWDLSPTFNANLLYGSHTLSLALSKLDQSSQILNNGVDTMTVGLNYRYTQAKYTFGLDANWYDRQPDNVTTVWTNAWRIGAYITYNFDKPSAKLAMAGPSAATEVISSTPSIERVQIDIARLKPGMQRAAAETLIAEAGLGDATEQAGFLIWYAQIFRDMSEGQRLALDVQQGQLRRSAVIIDFFNATDVASIQTTFERMRRQLLAVYGQPDNFFDQGSFTANLAVELAAGRFIRVMEWQRDGGMLRFGIPHRNDGRIRMELQFTRSFTTLKDRLWSMEEVQ